MATDALIFDGFNRLDNTNNFAANTQFAGMIFTNTAGAFALHGNAINLIGTIVNASTSTQTLYMPLVLDTFSPTINAARGDIILAGNISESGGVYGLTKTGAQTVRLGGNNTFSGAVLVNAGTLAVDGTLSAGSPLTLSVGSWLAGTGTVGRVVEGSGTISPGNGPGILTLNQMNPSANMNFAFEFTSTNGPNYTAPGASINDVLRLTNATPFVVALGLTNTVNLYVSGTLLNQPTVNIFRGGFYTDNSALFDSLITGATYNVYFNGNYWGAPLYVKTVNEPAFSRNGYVMEFGMYGASVPEPGVLMFWFCGGAVVYAARRRQQRRSLS